MKKMLYILLVGTLLTTLLISSNICAETGMEIDPEDDVLVFNQNLNTGETEQTETSEVPSADIIEVSYDRVDGGTEVTVMFKVNELGEIETLNLYGMDEDELMDLLLNCTEPLPMAYIIFVITDQFEYELVLEGENCTLNYGDELDYVINNNEFSATFNLNSNSETITRIGAQSFFMDFSLTSSNVYLDAAPDSFVVRAEITAPSEVSVGEEVEFIGTTYNLADLFGMDISESDCTYEWDFDDGTSGSGENVTHTYQYPGTYTVQLTVTDSENNEITTTKTVHVTNHLYIYDEFPVDASFDAVLPVSELSAAVTGYNGEAIDVFLRWKNHDGDWETLASFDGIDDNLNTIEEEDCADVHYIMRYESNGTLIDSSYDDVDEKTGGSPLKLFVTLNKLVQPPTGYTNYTSNYIDGLLTRLIGKEEGINYSFIVPAEEAYGTQRLQVGDRFYSSSFALNTINPSLSMNQTLEVTKFTSTNLSLKWVELDDYGDFTMPQIVLNDLNAATQEDMIIIPPPYFIWENTSEIIDYDEDFATIFTTPTATENLYDSFEQVQFGFGQNDVFTIFPDATTASFNDTTIVLISDPEIGAEYEYSYSYFGQEIVLIYTVKNVTEDTIGLLIETEGSDQTQNQTVVRSLEFSRFYEFPRTYENIPSEYQEALLGDELEQQGYSLHPLAGEDLLFDISIEHVAKTSQYHRYTFYPSGEEWNEQDTMYTWSVNVTDGSNWCNETYHFTNTSQEMFTISGTVYYTGSETGSISIGVFDHVPDEGESPMYYTMLSEPGPYTIHVPNGTYYVGAFMDVNGDDQFSYEPAGCAINETWWDTADPITISGSNVNDADITLSKNMFDIYTVTGSLYYDEPVSDSLIVAAFDESTWNEPGAEPVSYISIDSLGEYSLSLPNGSYYLLGFIDEDDTMIPDDGEPMGFAINKTLVEGPSLITVDGSEVHSCDITLHDWYTISGTIFYEGVETGEIHFGAENDSLPSYGGIISEPGSYSVLVPEGRYIIGAAMDANGNGYHDVGDEPLGVAINASSSEEIDWIYIDEDKENIDITLYDDFSIPVVQVNDDFTPSNTYAWGVTQFDNIQQAIDVVDADGSIIVHDGTYIENLIIEKPVSIIGTDKYNVIIDGNQSGTVLLIDSNGVSISNISVVNGSDWYPHAGIRIDSSVNSSITDCLIYDNVCQGICLNNTTYCHVDGNIFSNNYNELNILDSQKNIVRNNSFLNNNWGCLWVSGVVAEDYNHTIKENYIDGKPIKYYYNISDVMFEQENITHLIIANADNITIKNCNLTDGEGIHFAFVSNSSIEQNQIFDNYQTSIMFHNSVNNLIHENVIQNNHRGMDLCLYNHHNTISNNVIAHNNNLGIAMSAYGCNNTIRNNDINNNSHGIALVTNADENLSHNFDNSIESNIIHYNRENGIWLIESDRNIIQDNSVYGNGKYGLKLNNSNHNLIYNNVFDNENNSRDNGNNSWNISKNKESNIIDGPFIGGNNWSDYTGMDTNMDGLGDIPYQIAGGDNADYLPLINSTYDLQNPEVNLTYPSDGIVVYDKVIRIKGNITDDNGVSSIVISRSGYYTTATFLNDDDGPSDGGGSPPPDDGDGGNPSPSPGHPFPPPEVIIVDPAVETYYLNHSVTLYEGINTFNVTGYDIAGNSDYQTVNIEYIPDYPPEINNVSAKPSIAEKDGYVNVSYEVTDDFTVISSQLNITGPNGYTNVTEETGTGQFYHNQSYSISGTYSYFVWSIDNRSHENSSETFYFWICENQTTEVINETGEQTVSWQDINLSANFTQETNVSFVQYTDNPYPDEQPTNALQKYFDLEIEEDNETVSWPINITIYYTDDDLNNSNIDEGNLLGLYFWNETKGEWKIYNDTGVNTEYHENGYEGFVWANVWHLTPLSAAGDSQPPSQVTELSVTDAKEGKLDLSWSAATDNVDVDHYEVYWDQNNYASSIATVNHPTTSYQKTNLEDGTMYTFKVSAVDTSGNEGDLSLSDSGTSTSSTPSGGGETNDNYGGNGFIPTGSTNTPPVANISVDSNLAFVGENIRFDGSGSTDEESNITSWTWDFDDGSTETGSIVTHSFSTTGLFEVSLTVADEENETDTCQVMINVEQANRAPEITEFSGPEEGSVDVSYEFTFSASDADNDTIHFVVDWDDNSELETTEELGQNESISLNHSWNSPGFYKIQVYAEDEENASSSTVEKEIQIDVKYCLDVGYFIDDDADGVYDRLFCNETQEITNLGYEDDFYKLDTNGDGEWEYYYVEGEGLSTIGLKKEDETPGFSMVFLFLIIGLFVVLGYRKKIR